MALRKELEPIERDEAYLALIQNKIEFIEQLLEQGLDSAADEIAAFNECTGRDYEEYTFRHYWGAISIDEFVAEASQPLPRRIPDITKEELIEVAERLMAEDADSRYEKYYLELLEANVAMPGVSDLIYWDDLTPEEVIERALAYKPIILPPGGADR